MVSSRIIVTPLKNNSVLSVCVCVCVIIYKRPIANIKVNRKINKCRMSQGHLLSLLIISILYESFETSTMRQEQAMKEV